jgi:hypothetical protein
VSFSRFAWLLSIFIELCIMGYLNRINICTFYFVGQHHEVKDSKE